MSSDDPANPFEIDPAQNDPSESERTKEGFFGIFILLELQMEFWRNGQEGVNITSILRVAFLYNSVLRSLQIAHNLGL